jgi:hypothetical protein
MRISKIIPVLFLALVHTIQAQEAVQESSQEFWPEVDVWWRVSPHWRFSVFVPVSRNIDTDYREGSIILQVDYSWGKPKGFIIPMRLVENDSNHPIKANMLRGGYLAGRSIDDNGKSFSENTAFAEYHLRIPYKGRLLVTHRFRTDYRWMGSDNDFSARLRYRLMLEREFVFKKISFVPYFNAEAYFDTRYAEINRYRFIGGTSVSWSSLFALEGNFTYQRASRASVENLYALNVILHIYIKMNKKVN